MQILDDFKHLFLIILSEAFAIPAVKAEININMPKNK